MPEFNPFAQGALEPLGLKDHYLLIDVGAGDEPYRVLYLEGLSPGGIVGNNSNFSFELTAGAGLAANGTFARAAVTPLRVSANELLQFRCQVMTPGVSVRWFYPSGVAKNFLQRNVHARQSSITRQTDPTNRLATLFAFGDNQDVFCEAYNHLPLALSFINLYFQGFRYALRFANAEEAAKDERGRWVNPQTGVLLPATRVPVYQSVVLERRQRVT